MVVDKKVEEWLEDVDRELTDVQNLKAEIDEKESSLHGLCPNWCCRYRLASKASEKTSKLSDLQKNCSKFITVGRPKDPKLERGLSIPRYFSSSFKTTELVCNQIIEELKKESTKMVGLCGLGGVGKTTLAKFVGNQLRQQKIFDKVGIATVSQEPDIIQVQNELRKSLGWDLKEEDEKDRAKELLSMFSESKSSKILIILDDVWNELNLEKKLGIPIGDRDNCCKILLTTRKKSVCDSLGCHTIQLGTLTPEEGLTLLKKNAGIDVNDSTLDDVSKQVADECKGLPLAIEAVGSALRDKGLAEWKLALNKLRHAKIYEIEGIDKDDRDVYGCLKFSYDKLNGKDSKSCFLLCSLFPEDYETDLEDLVGYALVLDWYDYEDDPSIEYARTLLSATINELKAASLLLDIGDDRYVKMHDIVRDVALWMGSKDKIYFTGKVGIGLAERALEQFKGISLVGNKKEELPSGLVCPNLQILRLENTVYNHKLQVPEHFFEGMPALKVVAIIGGVLSLKSLQILTKVQVLRLIRCDLSDASFLGRLKRLQILYLGDSSIEIPEELGDELSRLKLLYVDTGSTSPITIKKFPQLEEFYGWIKEWEIEVMSSEERYARPAEVNSLPDRSVVCLPKDFTFPKLERYYISIGNGGGDEIGRQTRSLIIENYPPEATSLVIFSALSQNLEFLHLSGVTGCHNIVPSINQRGLNELTFLFVTNCDDLECIMDASQSLHGKSRNPVMLSRLTKLRLIELPELKWIWKAPAQHVNLQNLTKLSVSECNNLTYIFTLSQARSLLQLKSLKVSDCERLEYIVEAKFDHNEGEISVGDGNTMLTLPLLRKLRLKNLPKLISFCSENYYSIWPALEELNLGDCPNLIVNSTELEANLQYLGEKLQNLFVENCSGLGDTIPALLKHGPKNLEKLLIRNLEVAFHLEAIIADGQENKLLCHEGPTHIFSLQNLTELFVWDCTKVRHLLSSTLARNLLQLEELNIENCLELEQIIDEDGHEDHLQPICFPKLRMINIQECPKLKRLFHISVAPSLQKLTELWLLGNDELEEVFWHKDGTDVMDYNEIVLNELQVSYLKDLPNLTNFWPTGYQILFPSANNEHVRNCPKLRANSEGGR